MTGVFGSTGLAKDRRWQLALIPIRLLSLFQDARPFNSPSSNFPHSPPTFSSLPWTYTPTTMTLLRPGSLWGLVLLAGLALAHGGHEAVPEGEAISLEPIVRG